jgi:cytochrome c peroxidase
VTGHVSTAVRLLALAALAVTTKPPIPAQYQAEAPELRADWSIERAALGKRLFQERRLSRDGSVACVDCHRTELAFSDGRVKSIGVGGRLHRRNATSLVNIALSRVLGVDGRTSVLEEYVLGPIANPLAMDLPVDEAVGRLDADPAYRAAFLSAYGARPTRERLGLALAAYHRTLFTVDAPFDRFLAGDSAALGESARRGMALFGGKAECSSCHSGARFTDEAFHALGVGEDPGRGAITGEESEIGAFKTPSLRDVARTAPYMHDGSLATLLEVVELYDRGGNPHRNLDAKLKPLGLTAQEKADLVAFMEGLSGTLLEGVLPAAPSSWARR